MRKLIADHMVMSKHTSPHVTMFHDVDMTRIVNWRNKIKDQFLQKEGEKITFTPIFVEATTRALRDFPLVNASVDGYNVIKRKNVNIGMATALPNGNLIVPVIKNADEKNLVGLAKAVNDLANRARNNKLNPDEIQGGTFTLTNFGQFGNSTGSPIINQPQVAILGIGTIKKKPMVLESPDGDLIAIRHMMILSLAFDHRIVDCSGIGMPGLTRSVLVLLLPSFATLIIHISTILSAATLIPVVSRSRKAIGRDKLSSIWFILVPYKNKSHSGKFLQVARKILVLYRNDCFS